MTHLLTLSRKNILKLLITNVYYEIIKTKLIATAATRKDKSCKNNRTRDYLA